MPGRDCHAEFILSQGTFFDRLRMSGRKSQNEHEKVLDENSEGLRFFDKLRTSGDEGLAMTMNIIGVRVATRL